MIPAILHGPLIRLWRNIPQFESFRSLARNSLFPSFNPGNNHWSFQYLNRKNQKPIEHNVKVVSIRNCFSKGSIRNELFPYGFNIVEIKNTSTEIRDGKILTISFPDDTYYKLDAMKN